MGRFVDFFIMVHIVSFYLTVKMALRTSVPGERRIQSVTPQFHLISKYMRTIIWALSQENLSLGFEPGSTQKGLYSHRRWLEAGNVGFRKNRDGTT